MAQDDRNYPRHRRHSFQYHEETDIHLRRYEGNTNQYSDVDRSRQKFQSQHLDPDRPSNARASINSATRWEPSAPPPVPLKRSVSTGPPSRLRRPVPADVPIIEIVPPNDEGSHPRSEDVRLSWPRTPRSVMEPGSSANSTYRMSLSAESLLEGPYVYSNLEAGEIRLVCILSARMNAIKCNIRHVSLVDPPKYVAISYAWGDIENKEQIYLNGIKHSISASLFGALMALRAKTEEVLVWADALCIDQHNNSEKSDQIKLMTSIYASAKSVAIWLGPTLQNSRSAISFLKDLSNRSKSGEPVKSWITSEENDENIVAVAGLFSRSYWKRLWVVQEIFNASEITVYCGSAKISWLALNEASDHLYNYRSEIAARAAKINPHHNVQVLFNEGPRSLLDRQEVYGHGEEVEVLLNVLKRCRQKFSEKPQDKVFGLLGVLPESIQDDFRVDYNISVKEVFTDVVDLLVYTTKSLDVICESIHFPAHSNSANLPSWVPDWSHNPVSRSLSSYGFSASENRPARCKINKRRDELEVFAVRLDTIKYYGISVGTQCTTADYLMAFLNWRAVLMKSFGRANLHKESLRKHEEFCRVLNLGQASSRQRSDEWMRDCYHVFSSLIQDRLPYLEIDPELQWHAADTRMHPEERRHFLREQFGQRMMGRAFCITEDNRMGLGSGALIAGDIIVVPIGCRTPVILRADPFCPSKHRLVGDIYIDRYMHGRAMELHRLDPSRCKKYVLI